MQKRLGTLLLAAALGGLLAAPIARADADPDEKKKQEKGPDAEGRGPGVPHPPEENPLPEIIELMRKVEERLAEADAGRWTQEEQQRIAEALKGQELAVGKLRDLIRQAEEQASQGQGGGESNQEKKQQQSREPQPRPEPRREDERRGAANPQQSGKPQSERNPKDGSRRPEEQRRLAEEREREEAGKADPARAPEATGSWGNLPEKKAREVIDAKSRPKPPQWRRQLEEYYRRLMESRD